MWFKVVLTDIMTGSNCFGCKVNSARLIGNPLHSGNKNIIDEPLQPPGENTRLYQGSRTPTAQVMTWNWKVIRCQINHGNRNFMWLLVKEEVLPRRGKKLSLRGKRHRKLQRQQLTIGTQCNFGGASLIKDTLHSKKKSVSYMFLSFKRARFGASHIRKFSKTRHWFLMSSLRAKICGSCRVEDAAMWATARRANKIKSKDTAPVSVTQPF